MPALLDETEDEDEDEAPKPRDSAHFVRDVFLALFLLAMCSDEDDVDASRWRRCWAVVVAVAAGLTLKPSASSRDEDATRREVTAVASDFIVFNWVGSYYELILLLQRRRAAAACGIVRWTMDDGACGGETSPPAFLTTVADRRIE